jgi:hypothetical protein
MKAFGMVLIISKINGLVIGIKIKEKAFGL